MKVKDLIKELEDYNKEAEVSVVVDSQPRCFLIAFGSSEGMNQDNCSDVVFYTDPTDEGK